MARGQVPAVAGVDAGPPCANHGLRLRSVRIGGRSLHAGGQERVHRHQGRVGAGHLRIRGQRESSRSRALRDADRVLDPREQGLDARQVHLLVLHQQLRVYPRLPRGFARKRRRGARGPRMDAQAHSRAAGRQARAAGAGRRIRGVPAGGAIVRRSRAAHGHAGRRGRAPAVAGRGLDRRGGRRREGATRGPGFGARARDAALRSHALRSRGGCRAVLPRAAAGPVPGSGWRRRSQRAPGSRRPRAHEPARRHVAVHPRGRARAARRGRRLPHGRNPRPDPAPTAPLDRGGRRQFRREQRRRGAQGSHPRDERR